MEADPPWLTCWLSLKEGVSDDSLHPRLLQLLLSAWRGIGEQLPGYNPQRHVVLVETGPRVRCAPREQAVLALVERSARKTLLLLSVQPQTPHITIVLIDGNLTGATLLGLPVVPGGQA